MPKLRKRTFKPTGAKPKGKKKIRGNQKLKGTSGHAVSFMTRSQATKKLQMNLNEFRKLCILKGIYPRQPSKTLKGRDKTYYLRKDILFLMHDPLIRQFAERRVWKRKMKKAKEKKMPTEVEHMRKQKPVYSLNHIVKERYPTFMDAIRDLDDSLTMIFLFSYMPSTVKITPLRVANCKKLCLEFEHYIIRSHSLRKVFLSIKGIYYQAEIKGQNVTWIVPYRFTQKIVPKEVDYKVMLSFLEFYEVLVAFVNFKLYQSLGLSYPPKFSEIGLEKGNELEAILDGSDGGKGKQKIQSEVKDKTELQMIKQKERESEARLSTLGRTLEKIKVSDSSTEDSIDEAEEQEQEQEQQVQQKQQKQTKEQGKEQAKDGDDDDDHKHAEDKEDEDEVDEDDEDEDDDDEDEDKEQQKDDKEGEKESNANKVVDQTEDQVFADDEVTKRRKEMSVYENLFKKCHFWISREVPRESLQFVIKAFGGKVSWDNSGNEQDETITHHIVDRNQILKQQQQNMTREFIQPQWVYDCINTHLIIPTEEYKPGAKLPPHLSPFVNDYQVGYVPEYRNKLDNLYKETHGITQSETVPVLPEEEESESDEEQRFAQDLATEQQSSQKPTKKKVQKLAKRMQEEEEQKKTAEALLPRKKRRMLHAMQNKKQMKQNIVKKLETKRKKLQEGTAVVDNSTIVYKQKTKKRKQKRSDS